MRKVRVLYLRSVLGYGGGAEAILIRQATSLKNYSAFEMGVCVIRRKYDSNRDFELQLQNSGISCFSVEQTGIFDSQMYRDVKYVVDTWAPDIIDSQDYKSTFISRKISNRREVKLVSTAHGWTGHSQREKWLYYPFDKFQLRSMDHVIAVSNDIAETLYKWGIPKNKVAVLLNGVDPQEVNYDRDLRAHARAKLRIDQNEFVVLGLGRLERQKRFDILLEVVAALQKKNAHIRLIIAGEGGCRTLLEDKARMLGFETERVFLGHFSDIATLFAASDVLVQTSEYEGTPTVILEGMAHRIPIVATAAGGTAQLVEDGRTAIVVACHDVPALIKGVQKIIDNPKESLARVERATKHLEENFTFRRRTEKLESIYRSLNTELK